MSLPNCHCSLREPRSYSSRTVERTKGRKALRLLLARAIDRARSKGDEIRDQSRGVTLMEAFEKRSSFEEQIFTSKRARAPFETARDSTWKCRGRDISRAARRGRISPTSDQVICCSRLSELASSKFPNLPITLIRRFPSMSVGLPACASQFVAWLALARDFSLRGMLEFALALAKTKHRPRIDYGAKHPSSRLAGSCWTTRAASPSGWCFLTTEPRARQRYTRSPLTRPAAGRQGAVRLTGAKFYRARRHD